MAHFNITEHILGDYNKNHILDIRSWLAENVGEHYGKGDDYTMEIGSGWEIYVDRKFQPDGSLHIGWYVDITDAEKSTLFALRWL